MRPLCESLAVLAKTELNETPDRIQQDLIILKVWIKQQKHLRARTSDDFLIAFLRRCRYSLEATKRRIDAYFSSYRLLPEIMSNRVVNRRLLDVNRLGVHYYPENPKCDNQCALLINAFGRADLKRFTIREVLRFTSMAMEVISIESDNASVAGISLIVDLQNVDMDTIAHLDNSLFKRWFEWIQDCSPIRYKEVFLINATKSMYNRLNLWKNLLQHKMEYKVFLPKNMEELYEFIPRKCLPEEYGGFNGHLCECLSYMEDLLISYRKYFDEDQFYGTDEELRSGDLVTYEIETGVSGSFRKLETD